MGDNSTERAVNHMCTKTRCEQCTQDAIHESRQERQVLASSLLRQAIQISAMRVPPCRDRDRDLNERPTITCARANDLRLHTVRPRTAVTEGRLKRWGREAMTARAAERDGADCGSMLTGLRSEMNSASFHADRG
jgi:hypothetical protein